MIQSPAAWIGQTVNCEIHNDKYKKIKYSIDISAIWEYN